MKLRKLYNSPTRPGENLRDASRDTLYYDDADKRPPLEVPIPSTKFRKANIQSRRKTGESLEASLKRKPPPATVPKKKQGAVGVKIIEDSTKLVETPMKKAVGGKKQTKSSDSPASSTTVGPPAVLTPRLCVTNEANPRMELCGIDAKGKRVFLAGLTKGGWAGDKLKEYGEALKQAVIDGDITCRNDAKLLVRELKNQALSESL